MVEQCPLDMCLSYNLCTSNSSFGNLYFGCKDEYGNKVQTKNGIRCFSHFKPILLIPILVFHLIFALVLSLIKHNSFRIPISQIIIFLQINSVVFFSYSGIYILPLFGMSVDMLDGYCLWEGLNYNFKSFLSFSIIISLFLIGSTDITPIVLIKIYEKIPLIANNNSIRNRKKNINDSEKTIIEKTWCPRFLKEKIKKRINEKSNSKVYYWKSIWSFISTFCNTFDVQLNIFNTILYCYYTSIQIVYMSFYFFLATSSNNSSRDLNNYINLAQLIIFIVANSNLLQLGSLFGQGLVLTSVSFSFSLFSLFFVFC
ncbi:hypothetical protein DDB_G0272352 [Dictyostelium discoideum AX4]|uniref:Uncharacterized protein n=1 Tax=Dictyostelium discoideum TaxID=44689 RepID=Q55A53_DICDI|nr:hypothetical protein DDB_G0272352 [Dictyostelium discoideum AX4]EAL71328.1 hypothetical protein DDB_G0272352 [Dictyostelium discoideum AX4]|eukprot:XP_645131.1 hypothetical protein DDB_G0272352 [Dictyostelium discoideum AX4]